jgi:glycosyltransferase involved in cell wall biosynthesis
VFPSFDEGFGLPVAEAMACGCPVVTSNRSSLPEVAGDAALLVAPGSVEDIADAMKRLWTDAELRSKLASRGLARATRYTWDRTAADTAAVYEAALG